AVGAVSYVRRWLLAHLGRQHERDQHALRRRARAPRTPPPRPRLDPHRAPDRPGGRERSLLRAGDHHRRARRIRPGPPLTPGAALRFSTPPRPPATPRPARAPRPAPPPPP